MKKKTVVLISIISAIVLACFFCVFIQINSIDKTLSKMSNESLVRYFRVKGVSLPEAFLQGTLLKDTVQQLEKDPSYTIPFSSAEMAEAIEDIRVITTRHYDGTYQQTQYWKVVGTLLLCALLLAFVLYLWRIKSFGKKQIIRFSIMGASVVLILCFGTMLCASFAQYVDTSASSMTQKEMKGLFSQGNVRLSEKNVGVAKNMLKTFEEYPQHDFINASAEEERMEEKIRAFAVRYYDGSFSRLQFIKIIVTAAVTLLLSVYIGYGCFRGLKKDSEDLL
ncbi:MAG: hypothetical protein IJF71_07980 [Clostridia bacterium]|nr:hypothetical protein [Clostridia bacterium]